MKTSSFKITGMHLSSRAAQRIKQALTRREGVMTVMVNILTDRAVIEHEESVTTEQLADAVRSLGYVVLQDPRQVPDVISVIAAGAGAFGLGLILVATPAALAVTFLAPGLFRGGGSPGSIATFKAATNLESIRSLRNATGQRFMPDNGSTPWPVRFDRIQDHWSDEIAYSLRSTGSKSPVSMVELSGHVQIPRDSSLAGKRISGMLMAEVTYPALVGSGFVNRTEAVSLPLVIDVTASSLGRTMLVALYLWSFGSWGYLLITGLLGVLVFMVVMKVRP